MLHLKTNIYCICEMRINIDRLEAGSVSKLLTMIISTPVSLYFSNKVFCWIIENFPKCFSSFNILIWVDLIRFPCLDSPLYFSLCFVSYTYTLTHIYVFIPRYYFHIPQLRLADKRTEQSLRLVRRLPSRKFLWHTMKKIHSGQPNCLRTVPKR